MSHRKFECPRHGNLGFLPKKRTKHHSGKIKSFPKDDPKESCHITGFMGFKAGMTHIVRNVDKPGSKLNNKDVVEAVTILECPPIMAIGFVGYVDTPRGKRALVTVFSTHISDSAKRRFYKNWYKAKKHAFETGYQKKVEKGVTKREMAQMKKYCTTIRVLCATQVHLLKFRQRKSHFMEIQLNGGSVAEKVDWGYSHFEQEVAVGSVFEDNECIDIIGVTKGHGTQGVIKRFKVKRL